MYIQANIGRNAANVPMSDTAWENFQNDVRDEILTAVWEWLGVDIKPGDFQVHTGMGEWDGVPEESAHASVYFDTDTSAVALYREGGKWTSRKDKVTQALETRLSRLAFAYGQDAIAFIVTDSHLATR
jgi:hypothetical protein